ncbi:MAG: TIGR00282 family metallophosphoesterase [Clostridia bacterium]|nr:TIGR00282 family metallophosphoesterase [Clostridia bacterium]
MRILTVGDVCGSIGCEFLIRTLPKLKQDNRIDLTVVNGENSADGNGITPTSLKMLYSAGADVITGGNHSMRRKEVFECLENDPFLLRPHNMHTSGGGKGYTEVDLGRYQIAVINLVGRVYMPEADNPFQCADRLIDTATKNGIKTILVDFHAEATAEKKALAYYLDGKVSAVFGTHTHVLTADCEILPNGTGFISDIGMTGPIDSILGVKKELSIAKIKDAAPVKFELADGKCKLNGCIFEIDEKSGLTTKIKTITISE